MGQLSISYQQRVRVIHDSDHPDDPLRYHVDREERTPLLHTRGSNWLMDLSFGQLAWLQHWLGQEATHGARKTMQVARIGHAVEVSVPFTPAGDRMHLRHSVAQWRQLCADGALLGQGRALPELPAYPYHAALPAPAHIEPLAALLARRRV